MQGGRLEESLPGKVSRRFFTYDWKFDRPYPRGYTVYTVTGPASMPESFVRQ